MKVRVVITYDGEVDTDDFGFDDPVETAEEAEEAIYAFGIERLVDSGVLTEWVDVHE